MTKLRLYSRNLVKRGLLPLLNILFIAYLPLGCSLSTKPTYTKERVEWAIRDICKNEYGVDVKTRLIGRTLWVYLPLEDMFIKSDKPEKYLERFDVEFGRAEFNESALRIEYAIKPVAEQEKLQEYKYNKKVLEKINNVSSVLRRVLFSMERPKEGGIEFFCLVTADIKNGLEMKEAFYWQDLKKAFYEFISWTEYQHRAIHEMEISPEAIGDKEGLHLNYKDITWQEFIAKQLQQRIRIKFQKPEAERNADIDKEIAKTAIYTLKAYNFKDFSSLELNNLFTNNKIILDQGEVWAGLKEQ